MKNTGFLAGLSIEHATFQLELEMKGVFSNTQAERLERKCWERQNQEGIERDVEMIILSPPQLGMDCFDLISTCVGDDIGNSFKDAGYYRSYLLNAIVQV